MSEKMNNIEQMASNMDFEYKEAYWEEMAAILDANATKKAPLWLFFASACFGIFLVLSALVYFTNNYTYSNYKMFSQSQLASISQNSHNPINGADNLSKNSSILSVKNKTKQGNNNINTNDALHTAPKNNSDNTRKQTNYEQNKVNTQPKTTKLNQSLVEQDQFTGNNPEKLNLPHVNAAKVDPMKIINFNTTTTAPLIQSVDILNYRPKLNHRLLVELGAGYGSNSFSSFHFGGEKIHLGLVYQLQKFNWGFKTGMHVSWNAVSGLNYLERQKIYGFSSEYVSSQLNYRAIVNLNIPLEATYTFRRNTLGVGAQLNVLMATTSKVRNWTENKLSAAFEWNYSNNLRPVSVAIIADYTYQLSNRWRLGAAFSYMLTPIASNNNQVFRNKQFKLFSGQIFVQYDLKLFK